MDITNKIKTLARTWHSEMVALRRHFHAFPELGFQEKETGDFISSWLKKHGFSFTQGIAKTGIVGLIESKRAGKTVLLRADMDALPIDEKNEVPYKSKNKGIMHACGHDAHMACLMGAIKILKEVQDDFAGQIKFVFQPSEEKFPGGAIKMIEEGVLESPKVDYAIGQHVLPTMDSGMVGFRPGPYMASTDEIYIEIHGKGGHAATPELLRDPILTGARIVIALQEVISRRANPVIPSVLSFGKFLANGQTNIIQDTVFLEGTFRTFNEKWRNQAHEIITKIAKQTALAHEAQCNVKIIKGYPFVENHQQLTDNIKRSAENLLGKKNAIELEPRMTAEDFAYFSHRVPSCFYRFGVRNQKKGITANLHTSTFDIDEKALETGASMLAMAAITALDQ